MKRTVAVGIVKSVVKKEESKVEQAREKKVPKAVDNGTSKKLNQHALNRDEQQHHHHIAQ
jgi:hypothetical protein